MKCFHFVNKGWLKVIRKNLRELVVKNKNVFAVMGIGN